MELIALITIALAFFAFGYLYKSADKSNDKSNEKYTEDDLQKAFYKGREQIPQLLPDGTKVNYFIRPTFNGYLRELDGKEDPIQIWKDKLNDNK